MRDALAGGPKPRDVSGAFNRPTPVATLMDDAFGYESPEETARTERPMPREVDGGPKASMPPSVGDALFADEIGPMSGPGGMPPEQQARLRSWIDDRTHQRREPEVSAGRRGPVSPDPYSGERYDAPTRTMGDLNAEMQEAGGQSLPPQIARMQEISDLHRDHRRAAAHGVIRHHHSDWR